MNQDEFRFGFRIEGACDKERRRVDANVAFLAHAECNPKANLQSECYLSAFQFDSAFDAKLRDTGTTKGFVGATWSPWLWIDIDRDDIDVAANDARRLVANVVERYSVVGEDILIFYSGSKGFHIGLPTSLWSSAPSFRFHAYCRSMAEGIAAKTGVVIDSGVYDRVRAFRAPNSRHQKTGRHKRFIELESLMSLKPSRLVELSNSPSPFELPTMPKPNQRAAMEWRAAIETVDTQAGLMSSRSQVTKQSSVNRSTLAFIRDGAQQGDRHRSLFSASANLAELGCSFEVIWGLLSESALDIGLPPAETRRQIECGIRHAKGNQL